MKLYKSIARTLQSRLNCIKSNNVEWEEKWSERLEILIEYLPHGSGLNSGWILVRDKSHGDKIVLHSSFEPLNENGYYDSTIYFTLIILPSLQFDFDLHIRGNFGKYGDIKDYLYDIIGESLNQDIPETI